MYAFIIVPMLLIVLEQRFAARERPGWRDYLNTAGIMATGGVVISSLGVAAAAAAAGSWLGQSLGLQMVSLNLEMISVGTSWLDTVLQTALTVVLVLLVHDAWLYLSHRCEHRFQLLWAFHKVHHSEERMNVLTAGRDHFLQTLWRSFFSFLTIGLVIDLDYKQAAVTAGYAYSVLMLWSMFYHSSIRVELPWLDRIVVTPQVHRIHHSILAEHQDKNFADMFPLFDIIGGTYFAPRRGEFPQTGLSSGERHRNAWQALVAPFLSWKEWVLKTF